MSGIATSWRRYSASCSTRNRSCRVGHAALLLPAVQSAREAARRAQKLQGLGLSAMGAQQFVAGLPMNGADDRQVLPQIVIAALGSALAAHGAGYNQMTLDDTAGKEK